MAWYKYCNSRIKYIKYIHLTQNVYVEHFIEMNSKILAVFLVALFGIAIGASTMRGEFLFYYHSSLFRINVFHFLCRNNTLFKCIYWKCWPERILQYLLLQ